MNNEHDYRLPVNIGNQNEYSILQLAEVIIKETNHRQLVMNLVVATNLHLPHEEVQSFIVLIPLVYPINLEH